MAANEADKRAERDMIASVQSWTERDPPRERAAANLAGLSDESAPIRRSERETMFDEDAILMTRS